MSWTHVSQLAAQLADLHQPKPGDVAMVESMIADAKVKDPEGVGAAFLAQSITELLTPMAA